MQTMNCPFGMENLLGRSRQNVVPWQSLLLLICVFCPCLTTFRICSFNVQHFGEKKMSKENVSQILVQILQRCDIGLLQEVQDPKGLAVSNLLRSLNRRSTGSGHFFNVSSPPLGRKSYTEQYVFIFRSNKVNVKAHYGYDDNHPSSPDVFAREPYIVWVSLLDPALQDLVLVPLHTEPDKAAVEIDALYNVFRDVRNRWNSENIIFMGDFNADCAYLSKKKRYTLLFYTDPDFHWLINDTSDTTVRESTDCAYDRIVVYGDKLKKMILTARVYNFPKEFGLSETQALEVSDHYPVEVDLSGSGSAISSRLSFVLGLATTFGMNVLYLGG